MIAPTRVALLAALVTAALAGAGCGDTSCEDAVAGALRATGMGGSRYGGDRARVIRKCKDEQWSASLRGCLAGARDQAAVDRCAASDRAGGRRYGGGR